MKAHMILAVFLSFAALTLLTCNDDDDDDSNTPPVIGNNPSCDLCNGGSGTAVGTRIHADKTDLRGFFSYVSHTGRPTLSTSPQYPRKSASDTENSPEI